MALLAAGVTLFAASIAAAATGAELQSGSLRVQVSAIADDILRVRISAAAEFPEDASWVVPAELRDAGVEVQPWSQADAAGFSTAKLSVRIERSPLAPDRLRPGRPGDLRGRAHRAIEIQGTAFTLRKQLNPAQHFFGLGDKTGPLDRRGQAFVNWNTDSYQFQESTDPLYKSIPFFIATGGASGSYGIFLDNTWRSWFDFGKRDPDALAFGAAGGPIDYYLIYGPELRRVVERYTDLTGKAPLAPLWSLGFQQSRFSYMSATEVRALAARFRARAHPGRRHLAGHRLPGSLSARSPPMRRPFPISQRSVRRCASRISGWWPSPTCTSRPVRRTRATRPTTAASRAIIS